MYQPSRLTRNPTKEKDWRNDNHLFTLVDTRLGETSGNRPRWRQFASNYFVANFSLHFSGFSDFYAVYLFNCWLVVNRKGKNNRNIRTTWCYLCLLSLLHQRCRMLVQQQFQNIICPLIIIILLSWFPPSEKKAKQIFIAADMADDESKIVWYLYWRNNSTTQQRTRPV